MSVIAVFCQLQFSGIFVALGFVGNGVITVMINSPWQADDDADKRSGDNRGDSPYINLWPFRPLWILQSGCQPYARTDHNQRPAVKLRYCCNGRLPDGYHHDQSVGKAPRSLICCNASVPTFRREVFQAKLLAVGIPPTGKKLVASGACWFEFCLAWQVCEGDRSNQ